MTCPSLQDVRVHSHVIPAFIMFVTTVLVSVQGKTFLAVHCGVTLFMQVLFSAASLECPGSPIYHDIAYIVSFAYGLSTQYGLELMGPHGALLCMAFASMTAHYTCKKLFVDDGAPVVAGVPEEQNDLEAL